MTQGIGHFIGPNPAAPALGGLYAQVTRGFGQPRTKKHSFLPFMVSTLGMTATQWAEAFVYVNAPSVALPTYNGDFPSWASQVLQEPQLAPFLFPADVADSQNWANSVNNALSSAGAY